MAATTPPLTLGEILDRTVQLYRRNFLLFFGVAVLPSALYVAISGGLSLYYTSKVPALQQTPQVAGPAMLIFILVAVLFVLIGVPILLAISAVSFSALNFAAIGVNRGEAPTIRSSYARSFRLFWRFLGIIALQVLFAGIAPGVVVGILVFLAAIVTALVTRSAGGTAVAILLGLFMFLLILTAFGVCIWIWIRYSLAFPASADEDKKPWPSMQRSAQLTKGTRGRIFVMYLMVFIMAIVVSLALTLPLDILLKLTMFKSMEALALFTKPPIVIQVINLIISCLERAFTLPIYAISLVLFYNDQRTRMEGYDIEQLMQHAGWSDLPSAPLIYTPPPTAPVFAAAPVVLAAPEYPFERPAGEHNLGSPGNGESGNGESGNGESGNGDPAKPEGAGA
jgi:hypothetical protein